MSRVKGRAWCRHNKMMIDMAMVYVEEHRIRRHGVVLRGVRDSRHGYMPVR